MSEFRVVVPARMASTRLPGKPLLEIAGKPMVEHVVNQARQSSAAQVIVATDDARVAKTVSQCGAEAMLTSQAHATGTDRITEVANRLGWQDQDVVVNVQGDEPLIPPETINQVAELLLNSSADAATLAEPITALSDVFNPNIVKVVWDTNGRALYFSRAPIPWDRSSFGNDPQTLDRGWHRHIGIYAYRVSALRTFVELPPSDLERTESLEQLRIMENGLSIVVATAVADVPGGIDTADDLERVRAVFEARRA